MLTRDATHGDAFVYAVQTTGIFCRCTCPSKRPHPANVAFFDTAGDAQRAGFRPCKRCRPGASPPEAQTALVIAQACRSIAGGEESPDLTGLANAAGLSPFHFHRLFKKMTGVTPRDYWLGTCSDRLRKSLPAATTVTQAIHDAGFSSTRQFYEIANGTLGMTPKAFRSGGTSAVIRFAIGQCSLGAILVAATGKGICAVLLGDDPDALLTDLQDRFSAAELIGSDKAFEATAAKVIAVAERPMAKFALPLDIQGTAFQLRVWKALREIPPGRTASYAEIAEKIGAPSAIRAVAGACAANPIAIIVPCHRVIRSDGALSGYRWGLERKRHLLQREAALENKSQKAPRSRR